MKKETNPFMVYGYYVTASNENRTFFHTRTFGKLSNAQKWGNRFRSVGSHVRIYSDSLLIMEKYDTQKF